MTGKINCGDIQVGVVGLGLMGSSIVTSLLAAGHSVKAIAPLPGEQTTAMERIADQLRQCEQCGLLSGTRDNYLLSLTVSDDFSELNDCGLVTECVTEDIGIKQSVLQKMVLSTRPDTVIATNTSAIPISVLQQFVAGPDRFIGIHWAEPAFATRFLEIICGEHTSSATADWVYELACYWGKEPTLLKKDIRGFITNRLMYSVYREALGLVDSGRASIEDVDKAFKYDAGSWMTLMGIFRRMDFMGVKEYATICNALWPVLNNTNGVPVIADDLKSGLSGDVRHPKRFYAYTENEFNNWNTSFAAFNRDIYELAAKYPARLADAESP